MCHFGCQGFVLRYLYYSVWIPARHTIYIYIYIHVLNFYSPVSKYCIRLSFQGIFHFYALLLSSAKKLLGHINKTFGTLAFCRRWLERDDGGSFTVNGLAVSVFSQKYLFCTYVCMYSNVCMICYCIVFPVWRKVNLITVDSILCIYYSISRKYDMLSNMNECRGSKPTTCPRCEISVTSV